MDLLTEENKSRVQQKSAVHLLQSNANYTTLLTDFSQATLKVKDPLIAKECKDNLNTAKNGGAFPEQIVRSMQAIVKRLAENGQDTKSLADRANAAGVTVKAVEKAPEHAKEILSAYEKGATAEDVFKLMQGWGYTDWVRQERDRLTTYESLISTLANQYAAQMAAARQAQQFQMTSTTQQLQAIVDFVEKMVKEKKEQDQKETPQTQEKTAKKRKKKEEAEKLLSAIESGEKPAVTLFAKNKLYDEVERAQVAKDGLKVNELINNTKFQTIYEDHRAEELHGALKDLVPSKLGEVADVMKAGQGGQKVNLSKYDIAIQTALVVAYRKSLEEYRKQPN